MWKFVTTQSDLMQYNGMNCAIVGRVDPDHYDSQEVGIIYQIRLENGTYIQAYPDEIVERSTNILEK